MKKIRIIGVSISLLFGVFTQSWAISESEVSIQGEDPLPSWNEGPMKQKILDFVAAVSDPESPDFVEPKDRIAAMDVDGTVMCEHPINFQRAIALERLRDLAQEDARLRLIQPYKAAWEYDDEYQANSDNHNFIFLTAFDNYPLHKFCEYADEYAKSVKQEPFERKFTELYYKPAAELVHYLKENKFRVYFCTTSEEGCIRVLMEECMGMDHCDIIGNEVHYTFKIEEDKPVFMMHSSFRQPENRSENKCVHIYNQIGKNGKSPIFALGNTMSDAAMLAFAQSSEHLSLAMIVNHDDAERELEYYNEELLKLADEKGWDVVSMKKDFKQVFPSL